MAVKKYASASVVQLRPNSIKTKRVGTKKYSPKKTARQIVNEFNKKLKVNFKYDGRMGLYLMYKAPAKKVPNYYVLTIS